ncbi:MAG: DEAD/DEAH box helicase [Tildeniella torsiva UHER 1998/13D]|jgi:ATP-dependent RNA helicase RhlE|nr:DEAD/DEAH box helicase [Tildeniella torsiva UHER 1998/13D]
MTFEQLGLTAGLLSAVADQGYTEPTPIQMKAIPAILDGQDILASAQTGTGKTAGFTLPLLQRLAETKTTGKRIPRALVLTPTRELAAQVGESVITYGKHMPFRAAMIYGGVSFGGQIRQLRQGVDILIATPGRLLDHVSQGTIDLSAVEILVLDECDRMLDMGFIHDIRKIMGRLPDERQTLMFSATFSKPIQQLAHTLLKSPVQIEVAQRNTTAERVEQVVHPVDRHRKRELLSHIIGFHNWQQVLVFTRTKHGANRLAEQLAKDGLKTAAIHGNKTQAARARALKDFKQGRVRVLVATDVASRGIDIDQLPYVVNFEMPNVPEDYVHRIGRTGRAGNEGRAVSLISDDELPLLISIERMLKQTITQDVVPGYEPSFSSDTTRARSAAAPAGPRRQRPRRRSGGSSPSAPRRAGAGARG